MGERLEGRGQASRGMATRMRFLTGPLLVPRLQGPCLCLCLGRRCSQASCKSFKRELEVILCLELYPRFWGGNYLKFVCNYWKFVCTHGFGETCYLEVQ